jgi:hypothetical protein
MSFQSKINLSFLLVSVLLFVCLALKASAQQNSETPLSYTREIDIVLSNPLNIYRAKEPITISTQLIINKYPDFNKNFFRIKHKSKGFEPLDIPAQIRTIPGSKGFEEIVFQVSLKPKEEKVIELWYNPEGTGLPEHPAKTQSIEKYGPDSSNIAWENELIAYRSYNGIVDFFGKSYPHLRLHNLKFGSYHHERLWGVDPFIVGKKPGLGGVILIKDEAAIQCYGESLKYTHKAIKGGPVCSGAVVNIDDSSTPLIKSVYTIYSGRYENNVVTTISDKEIENNILIAPGILKFENETVIFNDEKGCLVAWGSPVTEYGTIGIALIWNPKDYAGLFEMDEGRFIKLKPSSEGKVKYLSLAVWNRGSAKQPDSFKSLVDMVERLALEFQNSVSVEIVRL